MRFKTLIGAAIGTLFAPPLSAETPTSQESPEFSVLTPAVELPIRFTTRIDVASDLPFVDTFQDMTARKQSLKLAELAKAERFDPARRLADRLVEALAEAGHAAAFEPIARKPAGSVQSLSRSDLPESPQGKFILDATIRWHGLAKPGDFKDYSPTIVLGWRILDPKGGVVEPTRVLTYVHATGWSPGYKSAFTSPVKGAPAQPSYPSVTVTDSCKFEKIEDAMQNSAVVWGCMGETIDVAAHRIVIDLDRARAARRPVSASGDSPSGTSTR
jgi:hypothetical protein